MTRRESSYSFRGDLMRIAVVAVIVGVLVAVGLYLAGVGAPVVWGVLAGALSTVLIGPVSNRRPARSNSSS